MSEALVKDPTQGIPIKLKNWRIRIFFIVWVTYMIYYIGRVNIGIAKPLMTAEFTIKALIFGIIGSAFFYAYTIRQLSVFFSNSDNNNYILFQKFF
ncbi:hypothetical protein LCGC14_1991640 [marine sediment metagenome]|uniref:Uncharacterized protein n=1 Tax=marine sediment metagenome TaxID=412755 RepID=A0A0F9FU13_9ZZZZ